MLCFLIRIASDEAILMRTQTIPFSKTKKMKYPLIIPNMQLTDFFLRTHGRVRNSRGKRAISVRATEVQLYL